MKLTFVDRHAVQGDTFMHRAAAWSKLLSTVILIAGIIICNRWELLFPLFLCSVIGLAVLGIPLLGQLYFYLYPLFFSLLYGYFLAGLTGLELLVIVLRAVTAVTVLLLLMMTTPYIKVFSVLKLVFPEVLTDIFFLTYRAFFLLLGRLNELRTAIKLRGCTASANLLRNLAAVGTYLGMAFITAVDYNERSYRAMQLRGYRGDIGETGGQPLGKDGGYRLNGAIILFSTIFFIVTVIW